MYCCKISTHTPHTGCDIQKVHPTASSGISTHTPHTGCDTGGFRQACGVCNFNSHTPHGVRRFLRSFFSPPFKFQLTHPTRGATSSEHFKPSGTNAFQLTHPTRGATALTASDVGAVGFQLTHPTRGATIRANTWQM